MSRQSVSHDPAGSSLPERTRRVLATLIQEYVEHGAPVSSRRLVEQGRFGLSSATVRNILATLEDAGYVSQPHTSAGRVPTDVGYRCYVDFLLEHRRAARSTPAVEARLRQAGSVKGVLSNVSHELSRVSHHLGFVLAPTSETAGFEHIDFVPLDGTRILVMVTAQAEQVCQKVVDIGERVQWSELEQGANYLNREFRGLTIGEMHAVVIQRLRQEQVLYDELLSRWLRLASSTLEDMVPQESVFVDGATFLFDEMSDEDGPVSLDTLRALLSMMQEKHRLLRLLGEYLGTHGLRGGHRFRAFGERAARLQPRRLGLFRRSADRNRGSDRPPSDALLACNRRGRQRLAGGQPGPPQPRPPAH